MKENNILQLILLTHGNWGMELIKSTELLVGKIESIKAFSLMPTESMDSYIETIIDFIDSLEEKKALIMTDAFGGTPCHVAALITASGEYIYAVNGLNMDMLLAADRLRREYIGKDLVLKIIAESGKSIFDIKEYFDSAIDIL